MASSTDGAVSGVTMQEVTRTVLNHRDERRGLVQAHRSPGPHAASHNSIAIFFSCWETRNWPGMVPLAINNKEKIPGPEQEELVSPSDQASSRNRLENKAASLSIVLSLRG